MKDQSLRVLIVEDSNVDTLFIIRELTKGGYDCFYERVETASSMRKALQEKQWDIILCDYIMPDFNAPSAIALLKEVNIDIPIIVVSGKIGEETAVECMRLGAQDYIMKGNMSRLCPAIARELEEAKVRNREKHTEEKLRESEKQYRSFFNTSRDCIFITSVDGRWIDMNDAAVELFGYSSRDELMQSSIPDLYVKKEERTKFINTVMEKGYTKDYPVDMRRKDGGVINTLITSNLQYDAAGKTTELMGTIKDITERMRAQEELRKSEESFRLSLDDSPLGVRIVTEEGKTLYANQATLEIYGYDSIEELRGTLLKNRYTPESYAEFKVRKEKRGRGEFSPNEYEINIVRKNGEVRHVQVFRKGVWWNGARQFQIIYQDITDRKQAEAKLRQQTDAMDAAIDGMAILNAEGEYVYLNKAHAKVYGYENAGELIGKSWRILYDSDVIQYFDQEIMPEFSRKGDWHGETIGTKKNGSKFPQELSLTAMANGGLICVVRDITERKKAEEDLKQTLESLRKSIGATIQTMVSAIEMRDPYTAGHQLRVANLAIAIAKEMGLPQDKIEGIRMAGSIHDIGKLSIPAEILSKPTKLTDLEFSLIKEHSHSGYEMLKDVESPWPLAQIVYQHHERMDGSGYPRNLKGDEILMEARIMAVADVVEAMASHRPYRPTLGIEAALEEIERNKGTHYDNTVVDACLKLFREIGYQLT